MIHPAPTIGKRADDLKATFEGAREASAANVAQFNAERSRINAQNVELVRVLAEASKRNGWPADPKRGARPDRFRVGV